MSAEGEVYVESCRKHEMVVERNMHRQVFQRVERVIIEHEQWRVELLS